MATVPPDKAGERKLVKPDEPMRTITRQRQPKAHASILNASARAAIAFSQASTTASNVSNVE